MTDKDEDIDIEEPNKKTNYIAPITNSILESVIKEIKKKKTKEKIMKNIVDPLLKDLSIRYYPHFIITTIALFVIIILLISILFIVVFQNKRY